MRHSWLADDRNTRFGGVTKGQEMGWFLFGGSDIVYLFQNKVSFTLETTEHQLQGEKLGKLTKK